MSLPKQVFLPVLEFASDQQPKCQFKVSRSFSHSFRVVSEGCSNHMKENLQSIYSPRLCLTMELCSPGILNALEDASDDVKEKSYYALRLFAKIWGKISFLSRSSDEQTFGSPSNWLSQFAGTSMSAIGSVAGLLQNKPFCHMLRSTSLMSYLWPSSSCNLDDGSAIDIEESDDETTGGLGGVSSDDEVHDEPRVRNISVTDSICSISRRNSENFDKTLVYFHEDVRLQAVISMKHALTAAEAIFHGDNEGPTKIRGILDTVMEKYYLP
ncbi:hypothetical protein MLD38_023174 [Melastoma candidum]|uniref:Uncharacterized protein n=1 Tax=Melastoma candidum TaxID=119954 RepID=A0ACB9QLM3_9MYRT|nr:hypothetical protein MLD38_023174 [Melastoma candidum]